MKTLCITCFTILLFGFATAQQVNTTLTYRVKEPAKKSNKTPVLIMLHGYGSNESDLFDISNTLDPSFIVFSLRGPYPSGNGGAAWYDLEFLPDQKFKYDYQQAKDSRLKILSFISNACKTYGVDSTQVFIMGFSQGAIMAYDLALAAPKKIKGVLALSGRMMDESKALKTDWLKVAQVKFFIAHGNSDNTIKIEEAQKAQAFLKEKKVTDVTYNNYEMPHILSGRELNDIKAWLVKAIAPKKAEPKK